MTNTTTVTSDAIEKGKDKDSDSTSKKGPRVSPTPESRPIKIQLQNKYENVGIIKNNKISVLDSKNDQIVDIEFKKLAKKDVQLK